MKETKTTKSKATTKPVTNLSESKLDTLSKTPIEIALKIDENGMTTASNLYAFLELEPKNFSHWCLRNIKKNKFAIENEDYIVFVIENKNPKIGGRPKTDYKITSEFAKKPSMTGNTERHEQARQYFIACEQGLKATTQKLQSIPNNSTNVKLIELLTSMDNRLSKLEEQSNKKKLPEKKYSRWKTKTFNKLNVLTEYVRSNSNSSKANKPIDLANIIHLVITETEDIYDIEINEYADLYRFEFCIDTDVKVQVLDVINHYKYI